MQSALDYARRAAECARLVALSADQMIEQELLRMRQTYLRIAEKLGMPMHEAIAIKVEPQGDPSSEA